MNLTNRVQVWMICLKSTVLAYCIFLYVDSAGAFHNIGPVILSILLYIFFNISLYILKNKRLKMLFQVLSILLIILCYIFLLEFFILLLPVSIVDVLGEKVSIFSADIAILCSVFIINFRTHGILGTYLLIMLLSIIYYRVAYYSFRRITALTEENDRLKEKNYGLRSFMEKKQRFEEQIMYTSKLEERNKISQEMHDKLGHSISASMLQLEASKMLIGKDNSKACNMIQNSIDNLREGMNEIRNTLKNIKPYSNEIGINKIKLLLNKFENCSGISESLVYNGDIERIDYGMWNTAYENINEALTNVLKYSKASKVTVSIEVLNKVVKVEVKDNGVGDKNIIKGLGLSGMEERAQNAGGKVIIDGGDGFSVITLLPI